MGCIPFQDKERKIHLNQNININNNNNYYNQGIINNIFYSKNDTNNNINSENMISKRINGVCCLACGEPAGKNFGGGGKRHNLTCMKCGTKERYGECFYCKICRSTFCSNCP